MTLIWRKIISRGLHPVLTMEMVLKGLNSYFKQEIGLGFNIQCYKRYFGATFMEEHEWQKTNRALEKKYKNLEEIIIKSDKAYQKLIEFTRQLYPQDFSQKTDGELEKILKQTLEKFAIAWSHLYLSWNVEEILTPKLEKLIEKILIKNKLNLTPDYCLLKLTLPAYKPDTIYQRRELVKLASELNKISKKNFIRKVKEYHHKFCWAKTYLMNVKEYKLDEIIKEIKEIARKNPQKIIKEMIKKEQGERAEAKKILHLLGRPQNLAILIKTFKEFALRRQTKVENLNKAYYYAKPLFDETAKRIGLSYHDFIQLTIREVISKKFDRGEIKKRQTNYALLMANGKIKIFTGQALKKFLKNEIVENTANKIIQGKSTFSGNLTGKVQILYPYQYDQIKNGYILVTPMTSPEVTPYLRKVKAIITDEGGLFSHAAILAREFNIPAILGTKVATQILKNSQFVEIDADKGIVRILVK